MYIVPSFNDMIALDAQKNAVCVILNDGKVEGGPVYKFNGQVWVKIKFYGAEEEFSGRA